MIKIKIRRKIIVTDFGEKGSAGLGTIVQENLIHGCSKRGIIHDQRRKPDTLQQ